MTVASQLALADLNAELARLDLEWERRLPQISIRNRHGIAKVPDRSGALFIGAIGVALTALIIARNPRRVGFSVDFLPLLALCAAPIVVGVWWWHKASVYRREHAAYQGERGRLLARIAQASRP